MILLRKSVILSCCLAVSGCAAQGTGGALPGAMGPAGVKPNTAGNPAIYVFGGDPDACCPEVGLANIGSTLYGTTYSGGAANIGALYSVTTSGSETIVHSFTGDPDGQNPDAALTNVNGTLYGSTYYGGSAGHGSIFSVASGSYKLLYSCDVGSTNDCTQPDSTMIYVSSQNALYGTGHSCGAAGQSDGCIFKVSLAGKKPKVSILYSFAGSASGPPNTTGVIYYKSALYGTTLQGGANGDGTVYKVTLSGKESIVYSFKGAPDGATPEAPLLVMGSSLYGTTADGGNAPCPGGCGTVFKVSPAGKEKVLYRFTNEATQHDGQHPQAALIAVGTTLYGTTPFSTYGSGTVYSVTTAGREGLVTDFELPTSDPSGWPQNPYAPVVSVGGTLYGTTAGSSGSGTFGTVFTL